MVEPIPLDVYYDIKQISDVSLSPDGSRVAVVATEIDTEGEQRNSLFVVPTDGSQPPHRLSRTADASAPAWSPDGSKLGFLATRKRDRELVVGNGGNEVEGEEASDVEIDDDDPKPQLWLFDLEKGGDAQQITSRNEGVSEFDWGPEGDRVVISSRDPSDEEIDYLEARREEGVPVETERLQHKWNGNGWLDSVRSYLFVVDIETREEHRLDDAYGRGAYEPFTCVQPTWGNDGRIAFLSNRTENPDDSGMMDIYTIAPDGTGLKRITGGEHMVISMEWDREGRRLAFVAGDPDNLCVPFEIYVTDGETFHSLSATLDRRLTETIRWEGEDSLLATIADEGITRLVRVHTDGSPVERVFEQQGRFRTIQQFDHQKGLIAFVLTHPSDGTDVYAMTTDEIDASSSTDDSLRRLSRTNDDVLDKYPMPACERVTFESDGHEIEGIAYLPSDFDRDGSEPRSTVVSIHGGPVGYAEPAFDFEHLVWTSRGYVVFCPNYRGSSSYGHAFAEELRGAWGTAEVADIVAGVESLVERGWTDPERVFGTGYSYGGIAQAHIVTQTNLFTAAAPDRGIYDMYAEYGASDAHVQIENDFGQPWENPDRFVAASSITDVDEIDTPLLIMAAGEDERCPLFQSEQLYVRVKKQGVDAKLVVYPDEHHNIRDPDAVVHRLEQLTAWFERHDPAVEAESDDGSL